MSCGFDESEQFHSFEENTSHNAVRSCFQQGIQNVSVGNSPASLATVVPFACGETHKKQLFLVLLNRWHLLARYQRNGL
jgi:hypothetical protein